MSSELIIDGQRVEMGEEKIGLTLQVNDLFEMKDRQASRTNTFSTPKTDNNKTIYGNVESIKSTTVKPYRKLSAKYIEDGIELITAGYAKFDEAEKDYKQTIYSGISDFFSQLDGLEMSDLDLSDLDHDWTTANIISSRSNIEGYIYPLVDWSDDGAGGVITNANRNVYTASLMFPCFFVWDLLNRIVAKTNYTFSGDILETTRFKNLLMGFPLNKLEYNDEFVKKNYFKVRKKYYAYHYSTVPVDSFYIGTSPFYALPFLDEATAGYTDSSNLFSGGFFVPIVTGKYILTTHISVDINILNGGYCNSAFYIISLNYGVLATYTGLTTSTLTNAQTLTTGEVDLVKGDFIYIVLGFVLTNGNNIRISNNCWFEGAMQKPFTFGGTFSCSALMPKLTQTNFIKTIAQIYGITFVPDNVNKIIYCKQFRELYANKAIANSMKDSAGISKRDVSFPENVKTRFGSYSQKNWMKWKPDALTKSIGLGDWYFNIDDETIEKEKDMFTLPFAASEDVTRLLGLSVVNIPKLHAGIFTNNTEPRLFMLNRIDITDGLGDVVYNPSLPGETSVSTDIPLTYFIDNTKSDSLGFDKFLMNSEYYEFINWMLLHPKIVQARYKLTVADVMNFDHFIPWYDDVFGNYFYVNVIKNFRKDRVTEVELIRM